MRVKIKRFDKSLPLPEYKTDGAAGFDLYVRYDEEIAPQEFRLLPANIAISIPRDSFLFINSRGSTYHKFGLFVIPAILDTDFCGDEDELRIQVLNLTNKIIILNRGTRIAQGVITRIYHGDFVEVEKMSEKNRGMLGTTGH